MARVLLDDRMRAGGVGRYARDLIEGLSEAADLTVVPMGEPRFWERPFTPTGRRAVARKARDVDADLVHCLHFEVPRVQQPVVVTIPDLIPLQEPGSMPNPLRRLVFRRAVEVAIERAARVIVPSRATETALGDHFSLSDRITVVPHGVGPAFAPLSPKERAAARDRFAAGAEYVFAFAGAKPHKNTGVLVEAARSLKPEVEMVAVMPGSGMSSGMRILDRPADETLRLAYGGALATVVPSVREGFGLPALESVACGTPVIAGPGLGAAPYLEGALLTVDVRDPQAIIDAVRTLFADRDERDRLAQRGLAVAERLTYLEMARRTRAVYSEAMA